jgi:hypothetical protein
MRKSFVLATMVLLGAVVWAQAPSTPTGKDDMSGMDMSGKKNGSGENDEATHAMRSMEGHMNMGPHMKMTELREPKPGDAERADAVVKTAREASQKYLDYHQALADGFQIFLPNVPQPMYHFTNYRYGAEAAFHFNPEHPTSLLYEKHGDDYKLVGVMYTAPKRFTEDQLDERIPLSIAQWHQHVNFCSPPLGRKTEVFAPHPRFGLLGSISTKADCDAAGGTFHPVIFNWMVHLYPFESDPNKIWSVERQAHDHH